MWCRKTTATRKAATMTRELPKPEKITATPADFFDMTTAIFTPCATPERPADYVSASGSEYWYTQGRVIRRADHWGGCIRSCNWFLVGSDVTCLKMWCESLDEPVTASCAWDEFTRDPWSVAAREICAR